MPARSKKQQMAAGAALSAKRGETPKSKLKGASKEMAQSMSESQLREMAATSRKSLPAKKGAKKAPKSSRGSRSGTRGSAGASGAAGSTRKRSSSRSGGSQR